MTSYKIHSFTFWILYPVLKQVLREVDIEKQPKSNTRIINCAFIFCYYIFCIALEEIIEYNSSSIYHFLFSVSTLVVLCMKKLFELHYIYLAAIRPRIETYEIQKYVSYARVVF